MRHFVYGIIALSLFVVYVVFSPTDIDDTDLLLSDMPLKKVQSPQLEEWQANDDYGTVLIIVIEKCNGVPI